MLWWSSRTLTKLKSQSQKCFFKERKYQYLKYKNKNHSGPDTLKLSDINLVPNLNFCAKYDRGLDLGFGEILKPLKWINITSFFLIKTNGWKDPLKILYLKFSVNLTKILCFINIKKKFYKMFTLKQTCFNKQCSEKYIYRYS